VQVSGSENQSGLHRNQQELADFFENAPVGMHWVGADGMILWANQAELDLLGYTRQQYLGHHIAEFHVDQDIISDILQRLASHATFHDYEARLRCKDGSVRYVLIDSNVLWEDGEFIHTRCIIRDITDDITERKRAEKTLIQLTHLGAFAAEIGTALTQGHTLRDSLQPCVEAMVRYLGAAFARIWTLNTGENLLELQASAGLYTHIDSSHARVPVGQFKIGLIAQERQPHLTNSVIGDPRINDQEWAQRAGMVAFAGYPLMVENRLVGVMAMFSRHPLSDVILQAMASVANEIVLGIEQKYADRALRRRTQELEAMLAIANALAGPEPFEAKAQKMLIEMKALGQGDLAVLRVPTEDGKGLWAVANSGPRVLEGEPPSVYPVGKSVSSLAYELGEPIVANDYAAHPRALLPVSAAGIRSMAVFPLKIGGRVLGIVSLSSGQKDLFTAERAQLLTAIASEIGLLVENARLQGETEHRLVELDNSRKRLELLSQRLLEVQETERRMMARELHDEIGQLLTGLSFTLEKIEQSPVMVPGDTVHKARALVDDLVARVRRLSLDLRPPMLDDLGLLPTLLWHFGRFTTQTGVQVCIKHRGLSGRRLPPEVEIAAFRVVQEALTNIVMPAYSRRMCVSGSPTLGSTSRLKIEAGASICRL
jgi:PAS domain S-box-containing protein